MNDSLPDMSAQRMQRIEKRVALTGYGAAALAQKETCGVTSVFDPQLENSLGVYIARQNKMALNPHEHDDWLVTCCDHELRHMQQFKTIDLMTCYAAHPMIMPENVLAITFMIEGDAYLYQRLCAIKAYEAGDTNRLPLVATVSAETLSANGLFDLNDDDSRAEALNDLFWQRIEAITSSLPKSTSYVTQALDVLKTVGGLMMMHDAKSLAEYDAFPLALNGYFDEVKPACALDVTGNGAAVNYLATETGETFVDRILSMLPSSLRKEFVEEKKNFIRDFYAAKDAADTPKGQIITQKIWLPGNP